MFRSTKRENFEILVVDDDKIVTLLHKTQLRLSKVVPSPVLFNNGKEALNYLRNKDLPNKNFLVLLDLNMPVLDGWNFLKLLEKDPVAANVHVVIVTSSINREDEVRSKNFRHVVGFCKKPLDSGSIKYIRELKPIRRLFQQENLAASKKDS